MAAAVCFLLLMAVAGRPPRLQSLVAFEAAGVMPEPPALVDRIELAAEGGHWTFTRRGEREWAVSPSADPGPFSLASHVEMSLRFMHVTAPVRVLARDEYTPEHLEEFGLEPPRYTVSLHRRGHPVLTTRFGRVSPQQVLQYARVDGRGEIYLLPTFVGQEWERVAGAAPGP
jgi:hypothetical protein